MNATEGFLNFISKKSDISDWISFTRLGDVFHGFGNSDLGGQFSSTEFSVYTDIIKGFVEHVFEKDRSQYFEVTLA